LKLQMAAMLVEQVRKLDETFPPWLCAK
jgi:hypothetical protein